MLKAEKPEMRSDGCSSAQGHSFCALVVWRDCRTSAVSTLILLVKSATHFELTGQRACAKSTRVQHQSPLPSGPPNGPEWAFRPELAIPIQIDFVPKGAPRE